VVEPQEPANVHVPFVVQHTVLPRHQPTRAPAVLPPQALLGRPQGAVAR
jgi:hypothetical protein